MLKLTTLAGVIALLLISAPTEAQRRAGNPFGDFHKQNHLAIGEVAPPMRLQDDKGVERNLLDFRGQWVFIEFGSYT